MRILLVQPAVEDFFFTPVRAYPLGLLSLGTVLEAAGFEVQIFNFLEKPLKKTLQFPKQFLYLQRYYSLNDSPFRLFSDYRRFGAPPEQFDAILRTFRPHVVGISANFSAYLDQAFEIAQHVKGNDRRVTTIFGGRAATASPELLLSRQEVDFVLRGEAEFSLAVLCKGIKKGSIGRIEGLCYKKGNNSLHIAKEKGIVKDINRLPILKRDLIDYTAYQWQGKMFASLLSSRGCGLSCSFCAIDEPFRSMKAQNVLAEMENCFSLGVRHFNFEDDNINLNPEFEKIIDAAIERFGNNIAISFMNGLLSLGLSAALRQKLITLGLTHLDLSVASTVSVLRKKIRRTESVRHVFSVGSYFLSRNVPVTVHFIIGFPSQRFSDAVRDLRILSSKQVLLGPSIYYPVIESRMFEELKKEHGFREHDYSLFRSSAACFDAHISRDRIFTLFYLCRIINFIKELIECFEVDHVDLKSYLENKTTNGDTPLRSVPICTFNNNELLCEAPLDRLTLGAILLKRLLDELVIYRVKKHKESIGYRYVFFPENFAQKTDLRGVLCGLVVRTVTGKAATLPSCSV